MSLSACSRVSVTEANHLLRGSSVPLSNERLALQPEKNNGWLVIEELHTLPATLENPVKHFSCLCKTELLHVLFQLPQPFRQNHNHRIARHSCGSPAKNNLSISPPKRKEDDPKNNISRGVLGQGHRKPVPSDFSKAFQGPVLFVGIRWNF
ncbi:hypothetical protein HNY73_002793 [Argiope bruennichi]|uniref:Uncharacterized protein n=1 Tax=Argiope bruennichi TaxID=94029 RepID=A0A8T0FW13_ARGBR|nr:hypothetical protein HNY73_002793 [Argiope bruennichi]